MKKIKILFPILLIAAFLFTSCVEDLNVEPIDPNVKTGNNVFKDKAAYKQALAKLYASYAVSGQQGGSGGNGDIQGIDENFSNYLRQYWGLQELPTDEAIMAWADATIKNFHWHTWAPNDIFIMAMYSRIFYSITICNEFIRNAEAKIPDATGTFLNDLKAFKAEARFLRALSYWHAIDMFGNTPFITEKNLPGSFFPQRITRANLFTYIETELKEIENILVNPKQNEYARADKAAAWFLMAKLYMNAKVYTGTAKYTEALTYINKVISAGYTIDSKYIRLFSADNHTSPEIVFPIAFDGQNTQQYGGMTFIIHATNGGGMPTFGTGSGWGGIRTIKNLVTKFGIKESDFAKDAEYSSTDKRGKFFFDKDSWQWEITNVGTFTHGIGVTKYRNVTSTGDDAPNKHSSYVSTDFPMFRLADAYLMYAEAVLRGGSGGDRSTALNYINKLRERAYGNTSGNIKLPDLTLSFILDERARELYWEGHRRTDLIRFGEFTNGSYVWEWKGKVKEGKRTESFRNLYPIPTNDLNANPNLKQNTGY